MPLQAESTRNIVAILLMKLCSKVVDFQFGTLAPQNFVQLNGSCYLIEEMPELDTEVDSATAWLYCARYTLPVFGGLLASACLGYVTMLRVCGFLMLLSTVLLSIAIFHQFICYSTATVIIAFVIISVLYGIIQPSVVHCLYRWHQDPRVWTFLTGAYYIVVKLGECVALLLPWLRSVIGHYYTMVAIFLSFAFLALTGLLDPGKPTRLVIPTKRRMICYCKIFTPMLMFLISLGDSRSVFYSIEMGYYLQTNSTANDFVHMMSVSPELLKILGQIFWGLMLCVVAVSFAKHLPLQPRFQAGILLKAAVSAGLLVASFAPPRKVSTIRAAFWTASVLDGAAEIVAVSAFYEIMIGTAPIASQLIIYGICFTVWGLANLAGRGLMKIFLSLPGDNPILRPAPGRAPLFFVYHLTILLLLALSSIYYRFVASRIVTMLFMSETYDEINDTDNNGCPDENGPNGETARLIEHHKPTVATPV